MYAVPIPVWKIHKLIPVMREKVNVSEELLIELIPWLTFIPEKVKAPTYFCTSITTREGFCSAEKKIFLQDQAFDEGKKLRKKVTRKSAFPQLFSFKVPALIFLTFGTKVHNWARWKDF